MSTPQRPRILVIEDDADIRELVQDYLQRQGFRVDVGDGGVALDRFRLMIGEPDLIVLDIMLPGEDGLSLCRRIRASSRVPILMLTARSDDVDRLPRLASDSSELLQQDVAFESGGFEFIYTKAGEAKVEMMAEATQDARDRAEKIAASGGSKVRALRSAKMGVVQINPLYSSATSWEGNNDTSAVDKTITATVSATFALR